MADTTSIVGAGTTITLSTTSGGTYTALGGATSEVLDITPPDYSADFVEATHYLSPNSATEFVWNGWNTAGDVTLKVAYVAASSAAVEALLGLKRYFKITLPDTKIISFAGFISSFGTESPNKGVITQQIKIKLTGKVTGPA